MKVTGKNCLNARKNAINQYGVITVVPIPRQRGKRGNKTGKRWMEGERDIGVEAAGREKSRNGDKGKWDSLGKPVGAPPRVIFNKTQMYRKRLFCYPLRTRPFLPTTPPPQFAATFLPALPLPLSLSPLFPWTSLLSTRACRFTSLVPSRPFVEVYFA